MVGNQKGRVTAADLRGLALQIKERKAIAVHIAGYQRGRRYGCRVRAYGDKEAQQRPTGVLAHYGNEYFLLGDHNVLVGTGVYDTDVVVPVVLAGVVIDRQGRVAAGKDRGVHRQIESGDAIVIGAAVELVITEH